MPTALDLRKDGLRSVHRRLNALAWRIALRSDFPAPGSQPSRCPDADPFTPRFTVLGALNRKQKDFHTRRQELGDTYSPTNAPAHGGDVFTSALDALGLVNIEQNEIARRRAGLGSRVPCGLHWPGSPVRHSSAILRATQGRRVRKGTWHA